MLSNDQKSWLKMAQRQICLPDQEYRECLKTVVGFQSSTDPRWTNPDWDKAMKYFEAIYWQRVETKKILHNPKSKDPFREPRFWARRNTRGNSSRQRYTAEQLADQIIDLERQLLELGFGEHYCNAVMKNVAKAHPPSLEDWRNYHAALTRCLSAKIKKQKGELNPF